MSDKDVLNNSNDSNSVSVSEDILNVIQSGQVKSSTSNKLHLLMDSSSDDDDESSNKPAPSKPTKNKKKKAEYIDSEDDGNNDGFLSDGFDVDLYGDEEDRQRLFSMTEVEREAILYERAQARMARQERRALEQRIRDQEERASGASSSTRRSPSKEVDLKRKKLDELKAKRMKKQLNIDDDDEEEEGEFDDSENEDESEDEEDYIRRRRAKAKKSSRRGKREDSDEDYYTEDSEEDERDRKKLSGKQRIISKSPSQSDEEMSTAAELDLDLANKLRLTRDIISQWIYRDGFDDICQKSLLRINLGTGKTGQPTYRVVEVKRIVQHHRTYQIKPGVPTNLAALVKFAKSERTFTFEYASNSPFTAEEFKYWKLECEKAGVRLPYNSISARRKIDKFKAFHSEPLTDGVIQKILKRRNELTNAQNAPRNLLAEQTILQQQLKEALERNNNEEEVSRIECELAAITSKRQQSSDSRIDRLAGMEDLNRRNRLVNLETGRQAEISRLQSELPDATNNSDPKKKLDGGGASNGATLDPFQRRKCKPTIIHMGEKDEESSITVSKTKEEEKHKEAAEEETPINQTSLFDAHNFDLDLDI